MSDSRRRAVGWIVTFLVAQATWMEILFVLLVVGQQLARHTRWLDLVAAAVIAVAMAGPAAIVLGLPAAGAVAALLWSRSTVSGRARVALEATGIAIACWTAWGLALGTTAVVLGIASLNPSIEAPVSALAAVVVVGVVPALVAAWGLHTGRFEPAPPPTW